MSHQRTFLTGCVVVLLILVLSCLTFYISIGPCPRGSFKCDNGTTCVAQRKICDKHNDCADREDEHPVTCGMLYGGTSLSESFFAKVRRLLPSRKCNVRMERCFRSCRPVPTLFCKGRNFLRMPRIIMDDELSTSEPSSDRPIIRLYIPHNQIILENSSFANMLLERIDLSWNQIKELPEKTFVGQNLLKQLYLRGNNLREIKRGSFSGLTQLEWLFLEDNKLTDFPFEDLIESSSSLVWLNLSNNYLRLDGPPFPQLNTLWDLYLDDNQIEDVQRHTFAKLSQLEVLALNGNRIAYIHPRAFESLLNLRDLRLARNRLTILPDNFLQLNSLLRVLYFNDNPKISVQLRSYGEFHNLSFLNLAGIDSEQIDFDAIHELPEMQYIIFDQFLYCSRVPKVLKCKPNSDGISSFANLLDNTALRYSAWMMALLTCLGNLLVLWVRSTFREENKSVSTVIRNLAIADLLMGVYLLIISIQDVRYRDVYHKEANNWVSSWTCVASGIIAMVSSEVSLLILAFMSMDRFLVIADPFGAQNRVTCRRMAAPLISIWLVGTMISVAPAIYYRTSSKFYGIYSGTCFPLHLDELYPVGWKYSAFLFFGVNMFLLFVMVTLYSGLLYSIRRTSRATPIPLGDWEITIRFFFIVLTSASCWASIIGFKLLALAGYEFGLDIYAFVVVYLLPLNSAINPLLYTFTTPHYLQRIVTRHWRNFFKLKCKHHRILTNGNGGSGAGTRGTHNYYSNQEESQGKMVPSSQSYNNNGKGGVQSPEQSQLEKALPLPSAETNPNTNKW